MSILMLIAVAYLPTLNYGNLLCASALQQNSTSRIQSINGAVDNLHQVELGNMSTTRAAHLYDFTKSRSFLNTEGVANRVQTEINKDSDIHQESEQRLITGNEKVKEQRFSNSPQNFQLFDSEWDSTFRYKNHTVPNIIMDLYKSLEDIKPNSFIKNFDLIRCFRVEKYQYTANGIIIKFCFNGIQNMEQIVGSELYIYRFPQRFKKASGDANIIRLYQILSKDGAGPGYPKQNIDVHELLGVIYVSPYDQGWQIFNVDKSLEKWQTTEPNLGFLISVTDTWGNIIDPRHFGLNITQSSNSPLLVVHLRQFVSTNDPAKVKNFRENTLTWKNGNELGNSPENLSKEDELKEMCNRCSFYIDFEKGDFNNFIIHPKGVMLYRCSGKCQLPLSDFTNHAKLVNIFQKTNLTESYCVPNKYLPTILVFYDLFGNIIIKKYYDMIVSSCSCR